ncbi:DUF2075 domain-containing protein [Rhizobium bangladeshense]|uniref:nuclease-related domain-containing DEAD/DEAH box helicase n=1 Tax=Rhizobium bangladeshense TaxID=1138189 RepID=UPI001C83DAEF|nr:nuclease-related domain-containing DEAD/DEAH box helicase [Rhizobium bangladeshense]MBX4899817.1 DUF2075 domain-containing protein [Rhizobium bangladeshense]
MAILIPEAPKKCPNGERLVYERIGRELPDGWVALHSLGLPNHETKIWGEADIVIVSSAGIFAIEVKGGKVSCTDGVWTFGGPDFQSYSKKEDPWTQAKSAMMAVRERLQEASPEFRNTLFGYGVIMPFTPFLVSGTEFLPEVLLDRRHFRQPLGHYISRIERYWRAAGERKHGRTYQGLTPDLIRKARQILRPDLDTALSIGGWLTGVESQLLQLTNEQIRVSRRMAANPRTVVRGAAGTGKSVLALDRARQQVDLGRRVLFLCFNQLLASHVRDVVANDPRSAAIDIRHAHALYREIISAANMLPQLNALDAEDPEFFPKRFPELAADALCETAQRPWDVLIVDEAQDLLTPEHLDVIDLLVAGGLRQGCWHLFLDPLQNLYGTDVQEQVELRLNDAYPAFDDLFENCRTTRQVAVQSSIVSGIDLPVAGATEGVECELIAYSTELEAREKLESLVRRLLDDDVRSQDIVILSTRRLENSLMGGLREIAGHRLLDAASGIPQKAGSLLFSTMHGFKGLERMVVVALDMAEIGEEQWSMLHYAGLSRARCILYTLIPSAARKAYDRQARAFGARLRARPG